MMRTWFVQNFELTAAITVAVVAFAVCGIHAALSQ